MIVEKLIDAVRTKALVDVYHRMQIDEGSWMNLATQRITESEKKGKPARFWNPLYPGPGGDGQYITLYKGAPPCLIVFFNPYYSLRGYNANIPSAVVIEEGKEPRQYANVLQDDGRQEWIQSQGNNSIGESYALLQNAIVFNPGFGSGWLGKAPDVSGLLKTLAQSQARVSQDTRPSAIRERRINKVSSSYKAEDSL